VIPRAMPNAMPESMTTPEPDDGAVTEPTSTTPVSDIDNTALDTVVEDSPEDNEPQGPAAYGWHRC
jgi:hypothetical protein